MIFNSRKESARNALGLIALVLGVLALSSCGGGGSGTDNNAGVLPTCRDPEVLLDNGTCGDPRPPFELPACPEGTIRSGADCIVPDFPAPEKLAGPGEAVIFVNLEGSPDEKDAAFAGYNLHLWQDCGNGWASSVTDGNGSTYSIPTTWPAGPGVKSKKDGVAGVRHDPYYGAFFVIPVSETGTCGNYIVKTPGGAAQTSDLSLNMKATGDYARMAWVIVNTQDMRNSRVSNVPICINDVCSLDRPLLAISEQEAHWISPRTILWNRTFDADKPLKLYQSAAGGMAGNEAGELIGGEEFATLSSGRPMTDEEKALVPHLADYTAYDLPTSISIDAIKAALKNELLIVGRSTDIELDENDNFVEVVRGRATRIQLPHVLDALYADAAADVKLGVSYGNGVTASVWAPTAQNVELRVFSGEPLRVSATKQMTYNADTGVWSVTGTAEELDRKYYRYRVTSYYPTEKAVRRLEVTDPYSISLGTNGRVSQFVNLDDADAKPAGWDGHTVPEVVAPENMVIYETHVRDFSIDDASTTANYRGKYMAFTDSNSAPVNHLRSLVEAGLTHIHFLPTNDIASIKEDVGAQVNLDSYILDLCQRVADRSSVAVCDGSVPNNTTVRQVLASFDPQSSKARELIAVIAELDGFNWGYDPLHFNAPEGSYATDPQGLTRIKEMRAMNMALHNMGLRVVMDVVYPHTPVSGLGNADSIFDKLVPGYYYRTNPVTGEAEGGTGAGSDTAGEHRMMGKFIRDSVVQWASAYKVDGFRFDQSGFLPKSVLIDAYEATKAVDPDTYFYAEAWVPGGGSSGDRIAERAVQEALAGTGIGTFNDRIRNPLQQLALVKGGNIDAIRAGLAGNLKDFKLKTKSGAVINASTVGAYNLDPQEAINYVEKHDNETLWDWMHRPGALPEDMSIANRVRVSSLTLSVPVLSQGVPFIHMGSDLLRSKSMSPNSYNAGDWFNKVDFTKQSNNWGIGLPPELRDGVTDDYVKSLFANAQTKPQASHIEQASAVFTEFMRIAKNSPLFSLQTAEQVIDRVGFHDGGKSQVNGLIVMSIDDGVGTVAGTESTQRADLDPAVDAIVVVINATSSTQSPKVKTAAGFSLHQIQQNSVDSVVRIASFAVDGEEGVFTVPAYTTAVFVKAQAGAQGAGLSATASLGSTVAVPYGDTAVYVRGDVSSAGWDAQASNRMTYEGDGIYSVLLNVSAGANLSFKIAEANWSSPNLGANAQMEIGDTITLTQGSNDNISINIPVAGTYRFVLDASSSTTAPTLTVEDPDVYQDSPVYLRGTVTSAGWGDTNATNRLVHEGNSVYAVSVAINPGDYEFKVASSDWSTVDLGNGAETVPGVSLTMSRGAGNIKLVVSTAATYRFELDARNSDEPVLRVYQEDLFAATPIYLRGTVTTTGWGADSGNLLSYAGKGLYTKTVSMAAGSYEFKIAEENWSNPNLGGSAVVIGEPGEVVQGSNDNIGIDIPTAGNYQFTLDTRNPAAITILVKAVN